MKTYHGSASSVSLPVVVLDTELVELEVALDRHFHNQWRITYEEGEITDRRLVWGAAGEDAGLSERVCERQLGDLSDVVRFFTVHDHSSTYGDVGEEGGEEPVFRGFCSGERSRRL